jgi:hypothetical protein
LMISQCAVLSAIALASTYSSTVIRQGCQRLSMWRYAWLEAVESTDGLILRPID